MPVWLAVAIPTVVAVSAVLMWASEYFKRAHEIAKLRLEIDRLKREEVRASALVHQPTDSEVERYGRTGRRGGIVGRMFGPLKLGNYEGVFLAIVLLALLASVLPTIILLLVALGRMLVRSFV